MAGSSAEERIREKAVAMLRQRYPAARIIHELKLNDDIRIDLAAVTTDRIALVEIKSEKDTLKRLGPQLLRASEVGQDVYLVMHDSHKDRLEAARCLSMYDRVNDDLKALCDKHRARVAALDGRERSAVESAAHLFEAEDRAALAHGHTMWRPNGWNTIRPRVLLYMLWAGELRQIGFRHRLHQSPKLPMFDSIDLICEHLSGREIRREVCAALRTRTFARADAPIEQVAA